MAGSCCRVKTCVLIAFRRERYSGIARLDQYSGGLSTTSKYPCSIVVDGVCDRAAGGKDRPEGDEPLGRVPRVSNGNLGLLHIAKQSICILLFPPEGLCSYLLASIKARRNVMELRTDTDSHERNIQHASPYLYLPLKPHPRDRQSVLSFPIRYLPATRRLCLLSAWNSRRSARQVVVKIAYTKSSHGKLIRMGAPTCLIM
jgi:hypothetical protein